jgi:hypothetical protein
MEQKFRVWLVWGRWAILKKKIWAEYEQLLRVVFHVLMGKTNLKFFKKYCSIRTKKLHKMKFLRKSVFFHRDLIVNFE